MSGKYVPLYRKYRPQTFNDVIGQENLVKALTNAIELKRIAHAYLFCGPRGTGKTSCARILAKSLNCEKGETIHPCGTCASCVDITNSTPLDVVEIDAASNRKVENAEELIEKVYYAPVNGKYKIFIIDEVHMLSNAAFNALLKTFEEPPPNVIFILATTEPQKVIETIVSRCQRFDFRRITANDIVSRLKYIAQKEEIKITDEALYAIAKNVSGGLRDSVALLDQLSVLGASEEIDVKMIENLLGKISFDDLCKFSDCIINHDVQGVIAALEEVHANGNEPRIVAENLITHFRNIVVVKSCADVNKATFLTSLDKEQIEILKAFPCENPIKIIENLSGYLKEIKNADNPYLWTELALIDTTCEKTPSPYSEKVIQKPAQQHKIQPATNTRVCEISPKASEQKEMPENEEVSKKTIFFEAEKGAISEKQTVKEEQNKVSVDSAHAWSEILSRIESIPTRSLLARLATPVEITAENVTLAFGNENLVKQASAPIKKAALTQAAALVLGGTPKVTLRLLQTGEKAVKPAEIKQTQVSPPFSSQNAYSALTHKNNGEADFSQTQNKNAPDVGFQKNQESVYSHRTTDDEQVNMIKDVFNGKLID